MNDIHGSEGLLALIRKMMEEAMRVAGRLRRAHTDDGRPTHRHRKDSSPAPRSRCTRTSRSAGRSRPNAIIGAVVELACKAGIATPMIDAVYALIAERAKHLDR